VTGAAFRAVVIARGGPFIGPLVLTAFATVVVEEHLLLLSIASGGIPAARRGEKL
jgi:hypothetical protein